MTPVDWWVFVLAQFAVGFTANPLTGSAIPVPVWVPVQDPLVQACRELGNSVYPVWYSDIRGRQSEGL